MINKVILIGSLGKDPEQKKLDNGTVLANFSIATNESYKDKAGEWQDKTEWHNVTAFGQVVERVAALKKGDTIYLEGKINTRTYEDKNQAQRKDTRIILQQLRIIKRQAAQAAQANSNAEPLPW